VKGKIGIFLDLASIGSVILTIIHISKYFILKFIRYKGNGLCFAPTRFLKDGSYLLGVCHFRLLARILKSVSAHP